MVYLLKHVSCHPAEQDDTGGNSFWGQCGVLMVICPLLVCGQIKSAASKVSPWVCMKT